MEVNDQLHAPAVLTQRKAPLMPIGQASGGSQSRSGRCGENKNFEHQFLGRPARYLVAIYRISENVCGLNVCLSFLGKRNVSFNKLIQYDPTATQRDNVGDIPNQTRGIHHTGTVSVITE
jgi:hypothetical protein